MALTAAELKIIVEASVKNAISDMNKAGVAVDQTGEKGRTAGKKWQAAGQAFVAGGAVVGATMAVATQEAATFQQGLANVNTVARLSQSDTDALGDSIQQMSRDTGITTEDLTQSMYDLVSAGTITGQMLHDDLAGSMDVVASSANLAIGGMGNIAGTTDAMTSALNAYGLDASHAAEVSDIFAVAIERGKVTADEIGASLSNVAPIAASAGISLEEISATYATLTANGVPAAEATTQMRAAITALLSPNEKLKDLMAQTGINFAKVAEEDGLTVALQRLRSATQNNVATMDMLNTDSLPGFKKSLKEIGPHLGLTNSEMESLAAVAGKDGVAAAMEEMKGAVVSGDAGLSDALGRVEAYNFTLQTTGENATMFGENMTAAMDATGTASEQAQIAMDGPVESAKRLAANVMTFMQDVGGPAAQTVGPFLLAMNQLGPAMMIPVRSATALGGALGALGGKILHVAGPSIAGLGAKILPKLSGALTGAFSAVLPALGGAVTGMMSGLVGLLGAAVPILAAAWPFILAGAIIAGIVLLFVNPEIRDAVFGFIGNILGWIGDALSGLGDWLGGIFGGAMSVVATVIGKYLEIITLPFRLFIEFIGHLWDGVAEAAAFVWEQVGGIITTAFEIITAPIRLFIDFISHLWDGTTEAARSVWDTITGIIGGAVSIVTGVIGGLVDFIGGVASTIGGFFDTIFGQASSAKSEWQLAQDAAAAAATPTGQFVPSNPGGVPRYQEGTTFVPADGLAFLHRGEAVLPPRSAEMYRKSLGLQGRAFRGRGDGVGGGQVIQKMEINVPVHGLLKAETPADVVSIMRQAALSGSVIPRRPRTARV